jgi:multidrug transporter EmrE-like cation transporter
MNKMLVFILASAYASLSVLGATLIKLTLNSWGREGKGLNGFKDYFSFIFELKVFFGMAIIFVSALVLFKALSLGGFNYVLPMSAAINFILTAIIATYFFGEDFDWTNLVGITLIVGGVFVLNLKKIA